MELDPINSCIHDYPHGTGSNQFTSKSHHPLSACWDWILLQKALAEFGELRHPALITDRTMKHHHQWQYHAGGGGAAGAGSGWRAGAGAVAADDDNTNFFKTLQWDIDYSKP